jgi:hypothetical protein
VARTEGDWLLGGGNEFETACPDASLVKKSLALPAVQIDGTKQGTPVPCRTLRTAAFGRQERRKSRDRELHEFCFSLNRAQWSLYAPHNGHYMHRTVVTICIAQRSLYAPHIGHYMHRTAVTICTTRWSLYIPHSGHYMYRTVVTIYTLQRSLYVQSILIFTNSTFCPHSFIYLFCVDLRTNSDYFSKQH